MFELCLTPFKIIRAGLRLHHCFVQLVVVELRELIPPPRAMAGLAYLDELLKRLFEASLVGGVRGSLIRSNGGRNLGFSSGNIVIRPQGFVEVGGAERGAFN